MSELPMFIVDAFADKAFAGNPAAVCLDDTQDGLDADTMQKIAAEMNIAETAFIRKKQSSDSFENDSCFKLRYFTPKSEIPLCGHATHASATVLFKCLGNACSSIVFEAQGGTLKAQQRGDKIALNLPLLNPQTVTMDGFSDIIKLAVGERSIQELLYTPDPAMLIIRLTDETSRADLEAIHPDTNKMVTVETSQPLVLVAITCKGSSETVDGAGERFDFISRVFAPWIGAPEDQVCGAAHMALSAYWSKELNKTQLYARQCSQRGGNLTMKVGENLDISGPATVFMKGKIYI